MREIKFRAWNPSGHMLRPFTIGDENTNILLIVKEKWPIMQFTGLKDKNGKEIYEGDLLKGNGDWDKIAIVEWYGGGFHGVGGYKHMGHSFFKDMEIIGNIYQNSELIK